MVQHDLECPILVILHFPPIFSHESGPKQFGMLNFAHFTFPILSHQSGPKQFGMLNFAHFALLPIFPTKVVQNDLECSILLILHFFQSLPTKVFQKDLECSILLILHFSLSFPTKVFQND